MTRDALILSAMPMAKHEAIQLAKRLRLHRYLDDLISVGYCALCKSADRFDAANGAAFTTFAALGVRGAMIDFIRKLNQSRRFTQKGLTSPLFSSLTLRGEDGDEIRQLSAPPAERTQADKADAVMAMTLGLEPSVRKMLVDYYAVGKTQRQIAAEMKVSPSYVSQLFIRAIGELREMHAGQS